MIMRTSGAISTEKEMCHDKGLIWEGVWFYIHVTCQVSAYIVSVVGWVTGIKLCSDSTGIKYNTHINIGIALKVTTHNAIIAHGIQVEPWAERSISNGGLHAQFLRCLRTSILSSGMD